MPKKRKISPLQRQNRQSYRAARKAGWKLFRDAKLAPWKRKLAARALTIALRTRLGITRKSNESAISVKMIIPFAAQGLKAATVGRIPDDQHQIFCKLMDWYAISKSKEFYPFSRPVPEKIRLLQQTFPRCP